MIEEFLDNVTTKPLEARGHVAHCRPQERIGQKGPESRQEIPLEGCVSDRTAADETAPESAFVAFVKSLQEQGDSLGVVRHARIHFDDDPVAVVERFAITAKIGVNH